MKAYRNNTIQKAVENLELILDSVKLMWSYFNETQDN